MYCNEMVVSFILPDSCLVVTDTWVSMGDENEKDRRLKDFAGYQVCALLYFLLLAPFP